MDKNKGNPVSRQSKQWMEDALLKLMRTENYEEITIQEITDHAGLSRRTFYRNYSSKEEILEGYFKKIWKEYETVIRRQTDLTLPNVAKIFFTQMNKHVDFLKLINHHHLLQLFLSSIDEVLPPVFDEVKGKAMPFSEESIIYALKFSTGGFLRVLSYWLNNDVKKSPEELADIMEDIIAIGSYNL